MIYGDVRKFTPKLSPKFPLIWSSETYRISSVIRQSFFLPKQSQKSRYVNNPKYLDLSYKTDLDFWVCLGRVNDG